MCVETDGIKEGGKYTTSDFLFKISEFLLKEVVVSERDEDTETEGNNWGLLVSDEVSLIIGGAGCMTGSLTEGEWTSNGL